MEIASNPFPSSSRDRTSLQTRYQHLHELHSRLRRAYLESQERSHQTLSGANSSSLLLAVVNGIPDPLFVKDMQGRYLLINEAGARSFGKTVGEILGRDDLELCAPEVALQTRAHDARVLQTGETQSYEDTESDESGTRTYLSSKGVYYNNTGDARGVFGFSRDITARKQAEEALREAHDQLDRRVQERTRELEAVNAALRAEMVRSAEAEAKYRSIFENAVEGIYRADPKGKLLLVNPAAARLFGYATPEEMVAGLSDTSSNYVDPSSAARFAVLLQRHGSVTGFEAQVRRRDGQEIWVSENARASYDTAGRLLSYEGTIEDITARRQAQEELRATQERQQLILDNIPQLVFWKDMQSVYVGCNDNFARAAGMGAQKQIAGKTDYDLPWKPEEAEKFRLDDRQVIENNKPRLRIIETQQQADGRQTWAETNKVPLHNAQGNVIGVLGTYEDITERRQDEQKILDLNAELIQAYDATIEGWSRALDLRDKETEGHSQRVTEMALRLAQALGLSQEELVQVRRGALLHDIGKMAVPDEILLKPGPLTDDEWQVMRRHPEWAHTMLSPIEFLRPALAIPCCHHEKWDGSGYPYGMAGEEIPLTARAFAIIDVWDALRSNRPYRSKWSIERTRNHIHSLRGTHFDAGMADLFLNIVAPAVSDQYQAA